MSEIRVIANGHPFETRLPCMLEEFLVPQKPLSRCGMVEHTLARAPGWS